VLLTDEDFLLFFAITNLPLERKTLQTRNGSRVPLCQRPDKLKGTTGEPAIPFDMVSGRRFRPFQVS